MTLVFNDSWCVMKAGNFAVEIAVEIKESASGEPYLVLNPYEDVGISKDHHINLRFPEGASIEDARKVASTLKNLELSLDIQKPRNSMVAK